MQFWLGVARQDRKPIGKVCISVLAASQLPLTCLISQVFKSLCMPSQAHSSPISLIKVRVTLPVQSQVGHTAFMLGHAHYSDTLPVPPRLEAEHNARHHQPGDLGILNSLWKSRNETTNCSRLTKPVLLLSYYAFWQSSKCERDLQYI